MEVRRISAAEMAEAQARARQMRSAEAMRLLRAARAWLAWPFGRRPAVRARVVAPARCA